jgi:hypothetical protein
MGPDPNKHLTSAVKQLTNVAKNLKTSTDLNTTAINKATLGGGGVAPPPINYGAGGPLVPTGVLFTGQPGSRSPNTSGDHPIYLIIRDPLVLVRYVQINGGEWMRVADGPIGSNCTLPANGDCVKNKRYDFLCQVTAGQLTTLSVAISYDGGPLQIAQSQAAFTPNPTGQDEFTLAWIN